MKQITIPKKLAPFVKAFSVDEVSAKKLIIDAAKTIYSSQNNYDSNQANLSMNELEGIIALMNGIKPKDTIEMIYGAQIIVGHLLGLKLLTHEFITDQVLGLKLLKFSNEAITLLQKKRHEGNTQKSEISIYC